MKNSPLPKYSPESREAGRRRPGKLLLSSLNSGWTSLLVETYEQPGIIERFDTYPSADYLLVLPMAGDYEIESWSACGWRKALYRPGMAGLTAPFTINRLRWRSILGSDTQIARIYIPRQYFQEAREEYRKAGVACAAEVPDTLGFSDPVLFSAGKALVAQLSAGYPDLCADSAAVFLARHLLTKCHRWPETTTTRKPGFAYSEQRWKRVLDYMQHHFQQTVTLDDLAREAGASRFHFSRLFRRRFGVAPHRYLIAMRMQHARFLLAETDLSIADVVLSCGYLHAGHFAAAYRRAFGISPAATRRVGDGLGAEPAS